MDKKNYKYPTLVGLAALSMVLTGCGAGGESTKADSGSENGTCNIAKDYPNGPIELIVGYPAGGGTDSVGRLLASGLSDALDTRVNVVNRTGGAGVVGAEAMASASPDGQTLGILGSDVILSHWMGTTDITLDSFTSVGQVNRDGSGVLVAEDSKWKTAQELFDAIKENPGKFTASGSGKAGIWHLGLIDMLLSSGLEADDVIWVPSEGAAPALQQLLAGGVDIVTSSLGEAISQIDAGTVRPLAVSGQERAANFPDVPTLEEATGAEATTSVRRGLGGPAGIDSDIVDELSCHLEKIVDSDQFKEKMDNLALGIDYLDAKEFKDGLASDDVKLGELLDKSGLLPK